jgi:hypothetical protein
MESRRFMRDCRAIVPESPRRATTFSKDWKSEAPVFQALENHMQNFPSLGKIRRVGFQASLEPKLDWCSG